MKCTCSLFVAYHCPKLQSAFNRNDKALFEFNNKTDIVQHATGTVTFSAVLRLE